MITVREPEDALFDEWYAMYREGVTADREAVIVASRAAQVPISKETPVRTRAWPYR